MTERAGTLRRQAQATAEKRTAERDKLREAMPTGLAVEALLAQIKRLRRTPCETMGFNPASGVGPIRAALDREIVELDEACVRDTGALRLSSDWSEATVAEWRDVLTVVLHMGVAAGLRPDVEIAAQASKLGRRLDHIDAGGTWAAAKDLEKLEVRQDADGSFGVYAGERPIAQGFYRRDTAEARAKRGEHG